VTLRRDNKNIVYAYDLDCNSTVIIPSC